MFYKIIAGGGTNGTGCVIMMMYICQIILRGLIFVHLKSKIFAAIFAVMLICSCSREGFEESLNRRDDPKGEKGSASASQVADPEEFIFDTNLEEYEEGNCLYSYNIIEAASESAEDAAQDISDVLNELVTTLADEIADGRELEMFTLYDAVTCNDGNIFSVIYEVEFTPVEGDDEEYIIGLVFNAQTGERMQLEELIKPETLVTLILDEQSSKIPGRKEEVVAKKRDILRECGEDSLVARLLRSQDTDYPLDASFYVEGDKLVAAFSALEELGEAIEVSVNM